MMNLRYRNPFLLFQNSIFSVIKTHRLLSLLLLIRKQSLILALSWRLPFCLTGLTFQLS